MKAVLKRDTIFNIDIRLIALGLFILTVLTRLPFQSQYLYHWDSVNMAFGIREFNVQAGAPQYPGYIIYIALAQVLNSVVHDPQTTMLIISIVSSGLAVAALFYLGRDMFNTTTGLIGALFLMTSPLVWFYGEIALPHAMDLFCIILSVWLLYKIMEGDTGWLWLTAVFLALVGGFRQQDLLFLGPLILFAIYRIGLKRIVIFVAIGFVTTLAWFIPLINYSGGLQAYMTGSSQFTDAFWDTTSLLRGAGMTGLKRNLISKLIPYTAYAWSLAALPVLYWLPQLPKRWRAWLVSRKFWFLMLWMFPTLAFYVIIHMGQQGLVFVFFPALLLLSAEGLYRLFQTRPAILRTATAIITLVGAGIFIFGPTYPLGENGPKLLTANTLRENDRLLGDQIAAVRENFNSDNTLVFSSNWRHMEYYLPEYQLARFTIGSKWETDSGQAVLSSSDFVGQPVTAEQFGFPGGENWQVVIVDSELNQLSTAPLETVALPDGFQLAYLPVKANEAFLIGGDAFGLTAEN